MELHGELYIYNLNKLYNIEYFIPVRASYPVQIWLMHDENFNACTKFLLPSFFLFFFLQIYSNIHY